MAGGASRLKALLAPYPAEEMACWPVSSRVGNVKNNDPSLIEDLGGSALGVTLRDYARLPLSIKIRTGSELDE